MEKLYFVFDCVPRPDWGGLFSAYQQVIDLLKDHYEIHIISIFKGDEGVETYYPNITIHTINNTNIDIRFFRMFKYLKNGDIQAFFKAMYSGFLYFSGVSFYRNKIKKIVNENDKVIVTSPSSAIFMPNIPFVLEIHTKYEYFFGTNKIGNMQANMMQKPSLVLFRTKHDALKMKQYPASYMYNFFDDSMIQHFVFDYEERKNKILVLGRLSKEKDPYRMLRVATLLKDAIPNIQIDVYGDGVLFDDVCSKVKKMNLDDTVFMKGFISDKCIYSKYAFLMNTSYTEGFPLTIIEAKANGVPTISSFWGEGVRESINDGKDGYIVNDDEEYVKKLILSMNDKTLLETLSVNAYEDFKRFSKEKALENWKAVLNKI